MKKNLRAVKPQPLPVTPPSPAPPSPQPNPEPSFVFILTMNEANKIIEALDEFPGKVSRPINTKMIDQSNRQSAVISDVARVYEQNRAASEQTAPDQSEATAATV